MADSLIEKKFEANHSSKLVLNTGFTYNLIKVFEKQDIYKVEVPDVLFNLNSPVPCLDSKNFLLDALQAGHEFQFENPSLELVIFGHTDTSGEISPNYDLSDLRAAAAKALLDSDEKNWEKITVSKSRVIDYQTFLKSFSISHGYHCDPGELDDMEGPKTREAVKSFQIESNKRYGFGLQEDGKMGPQTWKAFLHTIGNILTDKIPVKKVSKFNYGFQEGQGMYGCGESFPIEETEKDNFQSQKNRRVELIFADYEHIFLKSPADRNSVLKPEECLPYNPFRVNRHYIFAKKPNSAYQFSV